MTEPQARVAQGAQPSPEPALAEARVVKRERWSLVWLVPLVALAIGAWLAVHTISQRGPTITIEFESASGLQAGKTKVKFKDVEIGQVSSIGLSADLETVLVTADLTRDAASYLTENTRFWIAKPRVTASQVSGLETLLSGAYVAVDPVTKGKAKRHFVGLKNPPVITTSEPGASFSLRAPTLGSLNLGAPVYYRHIQVGQVVNYQLDQDGRAVTIEIFITKPHDQLVFTTTRFWNASGIDVRMTANGVSIDSESLVSMLIGGIAFDTPDTLDAKGLHAREGQFFPLYANRQQAHKRSYLNKKRFVLLFDGSVRGLSVNAPVSLRGIQVGQVLDIQLEFDPARMDFQIPVLIEIEPERVKQLQTTAQSVDFTRTGEALMHALVDNGLRAQLKTGSLLTGKLYIEFDLHPKASPVTIGQHDGYPVLPTLPTEIEAITTKANRILTHVDAIPFQRIGDDLAGSLAAVRALTESPQLKDSLREASVLIEHLVQLSAQLDQALGPQLLGVLRQAERALQSVNAQVAPDAPLSQEALGSLREIKAAARSFRVLADYLERHPEALLKGKGARP
ncbi:intermembrane transport protein PqiB [Rhabdochromatium marinum]|uniref:PqiB family protein n=1 Tax=Rhabdochromatium marinum TaxID=48729 RepID=UPI0019030743|nr:MlaD family protein [Rhabdochromatium marinum]MBK1649914.1 mammalian cell entry protein [Rhabdochromatium marinum]